MLRFRLCSQTHHPMSASAASKQGLMGNQTSAMSRLPRLFADRVPWRFDSVAGAWKPSQVSMTRVHTCVSLLN